MVKFVTATRSSKGHIAVSLAAARRIGFIARDEDQYRTG
jgi:hypothetical protein